MLMHIAMIETLFRPPCDPGCGIRDGRRGEPAGRSSRPRRSSTAWALLLAVSLVLFPAPAARAQEDLEAQLEQAIKQAVARVAPSVVRIETFGGLEKVGRMLVGPGPTTGLVVAEDGYVISSAFNFVQQPSSILVTLPGGQRAAARIVARDHSRMLVLLKVNTQQRLVVPEVVPRSEMRVGQWTIAVGRTFDAQHPNMSAGILSATNRIWGKAIQTDAKVSPSNYGGPLVDIRGRVLGVLVPLSPQGTGEVAGAEWYDSGIGFAVPLADVLRQLDKMKRGEDLYAGILGVSLKPGDPYATPPVIAAVPPRSPAAKAGLQPEDQIVRINGQPIVRQTQLRHALGPLYAGEKVVVVVKRGDQEIEKTVELTDKLVPYEHPFLGILPRRDVAEEQGVAVRYVFPDSPAAKAGLKVDDRLIGLDGQAIAGAADLRQRIAAAEPQQQVRLDVRRGETKLQVQLQLGRLPTEIPELLPPAERPDAEADQGRPPVGVVPIRLPEEKNKCIAYVPENYQTQVPHGLVVWLHPPDGFNQQRLLERWQDLCQTRGLILLAPQSADPQRWQPTEIDFIRKTIDEVLSQYNIDRERIVVHGWQAGGAMAYLVAFVHRDVVRGVAAVDAAVPRRMQPPANDPVQRLAVYTTTAAGSPLREAIAEGIKLLREQKFPVTVKDLGQQPRYLNDEELEELVRWIDMLDRI